jgi:hypothetical protein
MFAGVKMADTIIIAGMEFEVCPCCGRPKRPKDMPPSFLDGCRPAGVKRVKATDKKGGLRKDKHAAQASSWALGGQEERHYFSDADGCEEVAAWECVEGCAVQMLDEQSGERPSGGVDKRKRTHKKYESTFAKRTYDNPIDYAREPSTGGASRFFYCAKASRRERNAGLEGVNHHPTVKPLTLMEYLVKLITPLGGLVLDPFLGSGTTALACKRLGRHYIGIEISREYCDIAERRLAAVLL